MLERCNNPCTLEPAVGLQKRVDGKSHGKMTSGSMGYWVVPKIMRQTQVISYISRYIGDFRDIHWNCCFLWGMTNYESFFSMEIDAWTGYKFLARFSLAALARTASHVKVIGHSHEERLRPFRWFRWGTRKPWVSPVWMTHFGWFRKPA
jgi:hypothetical protein